MADTGYLLGISIESVAVRLVVAALVAVPLSRLLLRIGIRQPRVRVIVSLVPAVVLASVLALSWSNPQLPSLWKTFEGSGLAVPINNTYANFAPMAVQILVGLWAALGLGRMGLRLGRRREGRLALSAKVLRAELAPLHVALAVNRVAGSLGITMPPLAVIDDCPGGACIHGIRRPQLVLDRRLIARLDEQELEAVIAHELAHVKRRDNLTSLSLSLLRDAFFFVPGSKWAHTQLHAERELAADQLACATTQRPGALASGLLKVMDLQGSSSPALACLIPEMPESTLVGRVKLLVNPQELSNTRNRMEVGAIATAVAVAAGIGLGAPAFVVHAQGVLALSVGYTPTGTVAAVLDKPLSATATAFDVYRSMPLAASSPELDAVFLDDRPEQFRASMLAACRSQVRGACAPEVMSPTLGLRARPTVSLERHLIESNGHAVPLISNNVFHLWVHRSTQERTP